MGNKKYDDSEYVDIENNSSDNESIPEEDSNMSSESESEDLPKGWTIETQKRKKGKRREGKPDRFYVSPEGKKYRSRAQMLRIDEILNASKKSSPKKKSESVERSISSRKRKSVEKPKAIEIADSDDEEEEEPVTPKKKTETPKKKTPEKKSKSSNSSSSRKKRKTSKKEEQEEEEIEEEENEEEEEEESEDDVSEDEVERHKKTVNDDEEEEEEEIEEMEEEEEGKSIEWEPAQISSQIEDLCLKLKDYFLCKLKNTSSLKPEKFSEGIKSLLNKIVSESSQHKSNVEESSKEKVARLLFVLESVTQSLIHCYPFEYEDGQDMLQLLFDVWRETLIVADSCAISESTLRKHIQFIVEHDRTFLFKHFPLIEKKTNSGTTPSKGKSTLNAKMFTQVKGLLKDCIGPIFCTSVHAWQFAENDFKRRKSLLLAMKHFERNPLPNSKVSKYQDFSSLGKWVELVVKENLIEELRNMLKSVAHRSTFYVRKLFWLFTPLDPAFTFLNAEKELKRVAPHIVHELSKRYFNIYPHAKEDAKNWLNLKKNFKSESEITFLDHLLTTFGHNAANGSTKALETHFSKQKDVEFGGEDFTPSSEIHCPSYYRGVLGWIKLAQYAIEKRAPDTKFEFEHREFPTLDSLILWWKENLTHHLKESDDELIPIVAPNISSKENNEWTKLSHLFNAYNRDEDFVKFLTNAVNSFF